MLKTLNTIVNIQVSSFANRLIYFLQKMPIIGAKVREDVYSRLGWKRVASVIVSILFILWGFLSHVLYIGLVVYLPIILFGNALTPDRQLDIFWHIFFILSIILAGISSTRILEPKRSKYIAVKLMRIPPTPYMRVTVGYRYIAFFIQMLPAMLLFSSWLGASWMSGVIAVVANVLWRIFCEYAHLWLFHRTGIVLILKTAFVWTIIFIGYAAAYAPLFFDVFPTFGAAVMPGWPFMLLSLVLGIFGGVILMFKTNYRAAVDSATKRDDPLMNLGQMMADARTGAVKAKDSDYEQGYLSSVDTVAQHKEGYAYMNAIFFARHRSLIRKPFYRRVAITGAIGFILIILGLLYREHAASFAEQIGAVLPLSIFAMSLLSVGENISKALFYNCDKQLLRYSFYRQDAAKHFRIRLVKLLSMNLTIGALLAALLTVGFAISGSFILPSILQLWACIISLSIFFSVHSLFLYYVFQPYTSELGAKNPFYHLFTWLVSLWFIASVYLRPDGVVFTVFVAALSLIYLGVAPRLVSRFAPRNFRLK